MSKDNSFQPYEICGGCFSKQEEIDKLKAALKDTEMFSNEIDRLEIEWDNSLREIEDLKKALREALTDAMNYWDNDPNNCRRRRAKEIYAKEIKLCGLEVSDDS